MSKETVIRLNVDVSEGKANLDAVAEQLSEMDNVEIRATADTDQAEKATKKLTEEVDKSTKAASSNASAFDTVKKATVAIEGPMGGISSRLIALSATWRAFIAFVRSSTVSLKAFRTALLATGIGAFIVSLGAALSLLRGLQPVMDRIERVTRGIGMAFDWARTRLGAFLGLNEDVNMSLRETIAAHDALIQRTQELRRAEVDAIVPLQKRRREINELREAVRQENRSVEERLALLDELRRAEEDMTQTELRLAQQRFDILKEQAALAENTLEDDRELAEAEAELDRIRGAAAQRRRAFLRDERRLQAEAEREAEERRAAERQRIVERLDEMGRAREQLILMRNEIDSWDDTQRELNRSLEETMNLIGEDIIIDTGPPLDSLAYLEEQIRSVNERINLATSDAERQRLATLRASYREQVEEYRKVMEGQEEAEKRFTNVSIEGEVARASSMQEGAKGAIRAIAAEAAANAARSAFATTPFPASIVLAGVAAGAAQQMVSNLIPSFAHGGSFVTDGPQLIQVGDNMGGQERVDITPMSSPNIAGPREGAPDDIRSALADVDWTFETRTEGSDLVTVIRKELRTQGDLGGQHAL